MSGNSDKAQDKIDSLDISAYYKGLVSYIEKCQTPMSIAIQGEWGSGKTSIMNFIKNDLIIAADNYKIVEFNTWQYSQFDLGDRLIFSLIEEIVQNISGEESGRGKNIINLLTGFLLFTTDSVMKIGSSQIGADGVYESVKEGMKGYRGSGEDFSPVKALKKLKLEFNKIVEDACPGENDKLVVFIDDLDRLEPVRAIELLECLKLFIECDKCVFVLAIDFDIVLQGVSQKYGWINTDDSSLDKAKSYFEKFIQLPFYVPVNFYKTDNFIRERLENIVEIESKDEIIQQYKDATSNSVGSNPRSINRLINTYSLALQTFGYKDNGYKLSPQEYLVLYILLCIQISFETFYELMVDEFVSENEESFRSFLNNFDSEKWSNGIQLDSLVTSLRDLLQSDEVEESEKDVEGLSFKQLKRLVDFTGVTSTRENIVTENLNAASARFNNTFDKQERYEKLRTETNNEQYDLLKSLESALDDKLGIDNFRIASQKYQYWTIYVDGKKFAEVSYKGRISINFGRGTIGDRVENEYYTREWVGFVELLRNESGINEVRGKRNKKSDPMSYVIRDNSNPIRLTGISNKSDINKAVNLLVEAYSVFREYNAKSCEDKSYESNYHRV